MHGHLSLTDWVPDSEQDEIRIQLSSGKTVGGMLFDDDFVIYTQYIVVWEIFACNNFRMLKFRMGKFSYNNDCLKFERAKHDFRF